MATLVGDYRIVSLLGRGGMGVVHRAVHREDGREVALKMVTEAHPGFVEGIRREIRTLAALKHPGIVEIVEQGVHDGHPWYAMELVEGTTLGTHVWGLGEGTSRTVPFVTPTAETFVFPTSKETLSAHSSDATALRPAAFGRLPEVLSLARDLCETLAYLHGKGIVHRDLKPDNVLVADGRPVLVDFGLASLHNDPGRESLDLGGKVSGTVFYMSPEQSRGGLVDARSDLYALGVMLFELVTGQLPFTGRSVAGVLRSQRQASPRRPSSLALDVSPALEQLILDLLEKDPARRIGYAEDVAATLEALGVPPRPRRGPHPRSYLYRPPVVGREAELERLRGSIDGLNRRRGGIVLVGGVSGVGKTRLVVEAATWAPQGTIRVVTGECQPVALGGSEPLEALRAALRTMADSGPVPPMTAALLAPHILEFGKLPGGEETPPDLPPGPARLRLVTAVVDLLCERSHRRPSLLLLDDLQWADEVTMDVLKVLATSGRLEQAPLLVFGTFRSDEEGDDLEELKKVVEVTDLEKLGSPDVAGMVQGMLSMRQVPDRIVDVIAERSRGLPVNVAELLHLCVSKGLLGKKPGEPWRVTFSGPLAEAPLPTTAAELLQERLARLPPACREVAEWLATVGQEADEGLLSALIGTEDESTDAVARLLAHQVLESTGRSLRFAHQQLRDAVYAGMPEKHAASRHRGVAEAIERWAGEAIEPHAADLGRHWERAGEPRRASSFYQQAGLAAIRHRSFEEAARLLEAFRRLTDGPDPERVDTLITLGKRVLHRLGRYREGIEVLTEAKRDAERLGLTKPQLEAGHALAGQYRMLGLKAESRSLAEAGLSLARQRQDVAFTGHALDILAGLALDAGDPAESRRLQEEAVRHFEEASDSEAVASSLEHLATWAREQGRLGEARDWSTQALTRARESGNDIRIAYSLSTLAGIAVDSGRLDEAERLYRQAEAVYRRVGDVRAVGHALGSRAILGVRRGDLEASEKMLNQALDIHRRAGLRHFEAYWLMTLGEMYQRQGRTDEAERNYTAALPILREAGERRSEGIALGLWGTLACDRGRFEEGEERLLQAVDIHRTVDDARNEALWHTHLSRIDVHRGDVERARERLSTALDLQSAEHNPSLVAAVMVRQARLARLDPELPPSTAADLLDEAFRILGSTEDHHTETLALCQRGHLKLATGASATEELRAAQENCRRIRATAEGAAGGAVARLERAIEAAPEILIAGEHPDDIAPALKKWCVRAD